MIHPHIYLDIYLYFSVKDEAEASKPERQPTHTHRCIGTSLVSCVWIPYASHTHSHDVHTRCVK